MRTAGDGGTILTRLGASVIMLPGGEVYESMQRGVIDAFEYSTVDTNWTQSFQEVADHMYISNSRAPTDGPPIVINRDKLNELPDEFYQILQDAWIATGIENYAFQRAADIVALENFKNYGVTVEKLPADVERALLDEATKFYAEMSAKDPLYGEIVASQDAFYEAIKDYDELFTPQY
jgi:TRAP-type mannitol/chloroaromatic compound transport system substrate-binding protein